MFALSPRLRVPVAVALASTLLIVASPGAAVAVPPDADPSFVQLDAGRFGYTALGLTDGGAVYSWGLGSDGQLGAGASITERLTPAPIALGALAPDDRVVQVSMGSNHALAVSAQGAVLAWGKNDIGQLGLGDTTSRYTPTVIPASDFPGLSSARIIAVSASGADHSLALSSTGQVFAWGWNGFGQLGDGSYAQRTSPVRVISGSATFISAGNGYSFAVASSGAVYSWGYNGDGQLANNTRSARAVPTLTSSFPGLSAGERIVEVAAGGEHGIAVSSSGKVYSWGVDDDGQLGLGSGDDGRLSPALVTVPGLASGDTVVSVDAGDSFSLARTADGVLYSWGLNSDGQLGLGDTIDRDEPVPVGSFPEVLDGATIVGASAGHTGAMVLSATGGVYGTGRFGGLLGDETASDWPVSSFTNIRLDDLSGTASLSAAPITGSIVSAIASGWNAGAVPSYQWQRDGADIPGATGADYLVSAADAGHELRVVISATAENYAPGSAISDGVLVTEAVVTVPDIQTLALPTVAAGEALSVPIVVTGTGPLYFSGVTLPTGLSIDTFTGILSGSLTAAGDYPVQIQVSSDAGVDNGYYTLSVVAGPVAQLTLTPSSSTPVQGDTIEITVLGHDLYGNAAGNLTASTVFTSDVDTDIIVGNRITFPHASPHTITALAGGVSQSLVIEVTSLVAVPVEDDDRLPAELTVTGSDPVATFLAAAVVLLVGASAFTVPRVRGRLLADPPGSLRTGRGGR